MTFPATKLPDVPMTIERLSHDHPAPSRPAVPRPLRTRR